MDLAEFLLARIAEDEAVARATGPDYESEDYAEQCRQEVLADAQWHTHRCGWRTGEGLDRECICGVPARVLAECDAKRRIVEEHSFHVITPVRWQDDPRPPAPDERRCDTCGSGDENGADWPCPTLRLLALPYADHPDYQQEWKV